MIFSKAEYIFLRLLRRFLFSDNCLVKYGTIIPHYQQNSNQHCPDLIVDRYELYARGHGLTLSGKCVLELGPGVTNSAAYELVARGSAMVYAYEPYARYDSRTDQKLLLSISEKYGVDPYRISGSIKRIECLDGLPEGGIDVILSHSVLEHVETPLELFRALHEKLDQSGIMLHHVDYRDHFFKYPFHKLVFSKKMWNRWLNPGNLPGWVLKDHLCMLREAGFNAEAYDIVRDPVNFGKVKRFISRDYDRDDPMLDIVLCSIIARKI